MKSCDNRENISMNIIRRAVLACSILFAAASGVQSTSAQIFYPGIIVDFNCTVPNPFIEVDGIERTSERGVDGYIEDLSAIGIEAKDVGSDSFIPRVCVNGSSPQLRQPAITITCQEIKIIDFQLNYTTHFTFTLTYQSRLQAPGNVRMHGNSVLMWGRPPCVTNSSSNTYSIEVFHTLELTYIIYITRVSNGTTFNITVSTTFYNLLQVNHRLEPCSKYLLEVCAHNTETELSERSLHVRYIHRMQGCSISSSDSEVVNTTIPTPINREDKTEQTNIPIAIVAGAIIGGVVVLLVIIVAIIFIIYWFSNRNRKLNAVKNVPNVEDFIAEDNMYQESNNSPPPTYDQYQQPERLVVGEEQAVNGVYSAVYVQTTQPAHIHITGGNLHATAQPTTNPSSNGNVKRLPPKKKQDKSPKRDLIYADLAVAETTGRIAQPAADTKPSTDYATVQIQPQTD